MNKFPITVILEDVRSALNVGAIFRTCDAANVEKLVLAGITPYPPHNKIPKTALGAIETVSWQHRPDKAAAIAAAKEQSTVVAVEITPEAVDIYDYDFPQPVTLVFGNEISGVSAETIKSAAATVKIPMFGQKESLNVATSFGIVVYEIIRQWRTNKLV